MDDLRDLFDELGVRLHINDQRFQGSPLDVRFCGELRPDQRKAAEALLEHDIGILSAATAFGKSVVAAHLIARRSVNTLVVVHRRQLHEQWLATLSRFLDVKDIGTIGAGKRAPTGRLDVAMIQSLVCKGVVDDVVGEYGHVIIDECHHISAVSFERVARDDQPRVIVSTGRYLGEGFDDERLDTLFLTLPVSWRGTLTQYAGRLHRIHEEKNDVIIYDYVAV